MRGFSTELKIGFFAVIVIAILAFMTFRVGGFEWARKKEGYIVFVYFENIAGLDRKTRVKVAGVDAGVIEKIELEGVKAKLTLRMDRKVKLYSNATASIKATGLLGEKYLDIRPGSAVPYLKDGDTIKYTEEVADLDEMVRNLSNVSVSINTLATSLNEAFGREEARKSLQEAVKDLGEITETLNQAISVNDKKLRMILDNINTLTASINNLVEESKEPLTTTLTNIKDFSEIVKSDGPELMKNLGTATEELKAVVEETRPAIKGAAESVKAMVEETRPAIKSTVESIDSIVKKIDRGEGFFGRLVRDERLYESITRVVEGVDKSISAVERLRTFMTFRTDYLTEPEEGKGYFHITLQPRPDKYYILGVVGDPVGEVERAEMEFTAQLAKRFKDVALRVGLRENTFGIGGDYFFYKDRGRITTDIWDLFNGEEGAENPHVRAGVDYFIFRHIFLSAGMDNIMNRKWRGGYVGIGLEFEDEDLKYILGAVPTIPAR